MEENGQVYADLLGDAPEEDIKRYKDAVISEEDLARLREQVEALKAEREGTL